MSGYINLVAIRVSNISALVLKPWSLRNTGISNLIMLCPIISSAFSKRSRALGTDSVYTSPVSMSLETIQCIFVVSFNRPLDSISKQYFKF